MILYNTVMMILIIIHFSKPEECTKARVNLNVNYNLCMIQFSSVQFSRSVVSDSLRPHESQHARPPCPSPSPRVHSDSCPLSPWCHPAISSWVVPFSSCPQSLPASKSFPMSQLFTWGGQSTGVSALASFFPVRFTDCNKRAHSCLGLYQWGGCGCEGTCVIWGLSSPSAQFCCECKTVVKYIF